MALQHRQGLGQTAWLADHQWSCCQELSQCGLQPGTHDQYRMNPQDCDQC